MANPTQDLIQAHRAVAVERSVPEADVRAYLAALLSIAAAKPDSTHPLQHRALAIAREINANTAHTGFQPGDVVASGFTTNELPHGSVGTVVYVPAGECTYVDVEFPEGTIRVADPHIHLANRTAHLGGR